MSVKDNEAMDLYLNTINSILSRQKKTKDSKIKYSMLIDKLALILDVTSSMIENYTKNWSEDNQNKALHAISGIQEELNILMEWVQSDVSNSYENVEILTHKKPIGFRPDDSKSHYA